MEALYSQAQAHLQEVQSHERSCDYRDWKIQAQDMEVVVMTHIIIVDMRPNNGQIAAIMNDLDNIAQFDTEEDAQKVMDKHPLKVFMYEIIDMGD